MTLRIYAVNVAQTSADVIFADNTVLGGTYDMQIAVRPDFQFCVCPIFSVPHSDEAQTHVGGLNAGTAYYARVRNRAADNTVYPWGKAFGFRTLPGLAQITTPAAVMIEPAALITPIEQTGLLTSGDLPGYPPINMFVDAPIAWRGKPNQFGDYAFYVNTHGEPIDTVALLNTNLTEAAQIIVSGGPDVSGADNGTTWNMPGFVPARASANLSGRPGYHSFINLGNVFASQWVRIAIFNCVVPGGVLHVEHLVMGLNRVSKNHALEKTEQAAPQTTVDRKRSGIVDRVRGMPMRKVDFELQMLTEAQYETIYGDLWRYENEPVLVVPNSKGGAFFHDRILFGDLSGGRTTNPSSPRYNRQFSINSII